MKITVIIPSRARPGNLIATADSLLATCAAPDLVDVIVRVDDDDLQVPKLPDAVKVRSGPRISDLAQAYNECCPAEGLVMLGSDDILFETNHWDQIVRNAYSGKRPSGVVYGDDCSPGANVFGTHPVISSDWIKNIGFLAPEGICRHIDSFWRWVGRYLDRYQRINFVTRHTRILDESNMWMNRDGRIDYDLKKAQAIFNRVVERLRSPI